jgi:kynureninase
MNRDEAIDLDVVDPIREFRSRFELPDQPIYLDGNSLGALPIGVAERVSDVIKAQWGGDLIASWNKHHWMEASTRVGDRIAPLIGADPGEVVVGDSTSINLYKLLCAGVQMRPDRSVIVTERGNFPSDTYMVASVAEQFGLSVRVLDPGAAALGGDAFGDDVAVVCLSHANYRTGALYDLPAVTAAIHGCGALALWDLAHTAGVMPIDVSANGVDFAVGCGYKFLNGGPGAPSFSYVARRLQHEVRHPLTGWLGHAAPFAMTDTFVPANSIERLVVGTPSVLSLVALDAALDAFDGVSMLALRAKSVALGELMIQRVGERLNDHGVTFASPADSARRSSHISLLHVNGYEIVQALIARGVVGDYREPALMRFGFAPLYTRYVDVFDAVERLADVLENGVWREPQFAVRATVT